VALRAQTAHEIPQGTIAIAKILSDVGEGTMIHKEGPQGFVAAVLGVGGVEKEIAAAGIVHVHAPKMSPNYPQNDPDGMGLLQLPSKGRKGRSVKKCLELREKMQSKCSWT
jgi:hypothetical protein